MSYQVQELLREVFSVNPTEWAFDSTAVEYNNGNYKLFVSDKHGGLHDIVVAHEALDHVGLIDNNKKPFVEYGIGTQMAMSNWVLAMARAVSTIKLPSAITLLRWLPLKKVSALR